MPAVLENRRVWSKHDWDHRGHRWSPGGTARGTAMMWWRAIRPRIHAYLPAGTLLEIAPGYGRWTAYLLDECERLTGVDLTPRCVDVCRERFAGAPAQFWVNDGESLPMVPDASVDLAFSLDSLVHVEAPQITRYVGELARTLKPGGAAFLHHSNLGAYANPVTGVIPSYITERHWRAASVSARTVREACRDAGLSCMVQEVINWIGRDAANDRHRPAADRVPLTDCFSLCVRPWHSMPTATRVHINRGFATEWRDMVRLTALYATRDADDAEPAGSGQAPVDAVPRHSRRAVARRWLATRLFELQEPIVRRLRRGDCPDCGASVSFGAGTWRCGRCAVDYSLT